MYSRAQTPRSAIVVGAGMVGLSTAWHLQERGVEVTVVDRSGVAAGSSWGNAGWLTPGMTMPLADPSLWTYGLKALRDPTAPLHIPVRLDPKLWAFLLKFAAHGTHRAWRRGMDALTPIARMALEAFDELTTHGVAAETCSGPFIIGFEHERESGPFVHEIEEVERAGQVVPMRRLGNAHAKVPQLSENVSTVYAMDQQRFIEPGPFMHALAQAVERRGGRIMTGVEVHSLRHGPGGIAVETSSQGPVHADVVVLATGAWFPVLAKPHGVRLMVQAGRGYSFSVATEAPVEFPIYFPARRVACTPYQGRLRIAGTMEFRGPDEPLHKARIEAILASVQPLLQNVNLTDLQDIWVGSRPISPDGLPIVGATRTPGVYAAGGHGMWGIVLGPATGKLLAEQIVTGTTADEIRPFDPLR